MHELALMEDLVDTVAARMATDDRRVAVVRLEIGELAGVAVDALRFCFDVCTHGTPLAGASLDIIAVPGRARCRQCGVEQPIASLVAPCACGSFERQLLAGDELRLKELEVQ